jgi:hypothetical protein
MACALDIKHEFEQFFLRQIKKDVRCLGQALVADKQPDQFVDRFFAGPVGLPGYGCGRGCGCWGWCCITIKSENPSTVLCW